MAQMLSESPAAPPVKRGPGRPPKNGLTPNKRLKLSDINENTLSGLSSKQGTPLSDKRLSRTLPTKIHDSRPLPTLPEPQSQSLPDGEYASIAASAVFARSLEQSRVSWTQTGVFERFWVKPETGKHAKPPPLNNPDVKSMKSRGRCRLRIEPHIFEVEVFVVDRPKVAGPSKQFLPPKQPQAGFGQSWHQQYQGQTPPSSVASPGPQPVTAPAATPVPTPASTEKKALADPVIGLLASRAGSDPELKALMREVAAGNAPAEKLEIFQKHINELNGVLREQKAKEETQQRAFAAQQAAYTQQQQRYVPPSPALPGEVVFSFTAPGASNDRFLFPQHCILETLTPQHLLASFALVTKGSQVANTTDIDPTKEYWSPITLMVEVAYGRENILDDMKRWVKPAAESRDHIAKIIAEVERVPDTHLALRLPLKGTAAAAESISTSKTGTPVPQVVEEKSKKKYSNTVAKKRSSIADAKALKAAESSNPPAAVDVIKVEQSAPSIEAVSASGRPTRATRKSSRLSDAV